MDVLVTGVSGSVAGTLARRLGESGWRVRALVRTAPQAAGAVARGWQPVYADLADASSLPDAVAGADVVVHAAACLDQDVKLAEAVNVGGTRSLALASLAAGVSRFVHISTMSVHGDPQPDGLAEDSPLATDHPASAYVATKARAEVALGEVGALGLPTVVLRPGAICSLVNSRWGDRLIARLADDAWRARFHPDDVIPWVHTDDLAEMTWLAATRESAVGQTFIAVDANVALREYFDPLLRAMGRPGLVVPDRPPQMSRCRIGTIRAVLGYRPLRTFDRTLAELVALARAGRVAR
jgi:dihydroflavonol-4-reductase